jgi:hypothetical protein
LAIALNPKRHTAAVIDSQAEDFISGAGKADGSEENGRKPVLVRVPADLLKRIDHAAKRKGISRSSFIVSSMADLLNGER